MARNPLYNNGRTDAQNNGLTHDNAASNPNKKYPQALNNFNNSYRFANTERFADVTPFLYLDCVDRDVIPYKSLHQLKTYTLQSPMMDEIYKHKFYSLVPYKAILPKTWELIYTNPTKGDDVPEAAYCNVNLLMRWADYYKWVKSLKNLDATRYYIEVVKFAFATESIFSKGSLLNTLKCNLWPWLEVSNYLSIDTLIDNLYDILNNCIVISQEIQPGLFRQVAGKSFTAVDYAHLVSVHTIADILRSGDYSSFELWSSSIDYEEQLDNFMVNFESLVEQSKFNHVIDTGEFGYKIDLSAVIAYQITCVSQVTDAAIDYLFNAQLFRDILFAIPDVYTFTYNGGVMLYDTFSNRYLDTVWFSAPEFSSTCCKLFSFGKSLKFGDYFTQMRPQRYGVGDLEIEDMNAIEVTRKIVYQRFLNWNNRVGPKYEDYKKELTGIDAMPDPTEPSLITHSQSIVGSYEVENTGNEQFSQQNSVTTLLRSSDSSFEFNIIVSTPSILLGLTSYDMERLYTRIMDRSHLKADRFDFFNHMLQYTGDQEINKVELDSSAYSLDDPIGYNTKDIHYKMQVSHASGGFISGALESWAFTSEDSDNDMSLSFGINPDFIRNYNSDFDRFYGSLSGISLGTYFHFILKYKNDLSAMKRAMDVAPDIL